LMPYFMPKQTETEVTVNDAPKPPSWFDEVLDKTGAYETHLTEE